MEILDLLKIGMNWGVAGVLALFFAHHAIKRTMRLESRLNAAAIDKLRTHCMITTKRQEVRT